MVNYSLYLKVHQILFFVSWYISNLKYLSIPTRIVSVAFKSIFLILINLLFLTLKYEQGLTMPKLLSFNIWITSAYLGHNHWLVGNQFQPTSESQRDVGIVSTQFIKVCNQNQSEFTSHVCLVTLATGDKHKHDLISDQYIDSLGLQSGIRAHYWSSSWTFSFHMAAHYKVKLN